MIFLCINDLKINRIFCPNKFKLIFLYISDLKLNLFSEVT
jgi:hypothetical protein